MDNALSALIYRQHFNPWVAAAQGMGVFAGQVAGHLHDKQAEDQKRAQQRKKNVVMTVDSGMLAQAAPDDTLYFAMGTDALGGNPDFNIDAPTLSDYDYGMGMEPNESEMEDYGYGDVRRSGCRFWGQPAAKKGNTASIPRQYAQKAVVNESLGANAHAHVAFKHRMSQHLVQDKSDKGAQALYLMWLTQNDPSVLEHEMFTPNMNVSLEHSNPSQSESWFTYFLHIQEAEIHGAAQEIRGFLEHPIDTLLDMDYSISHAILHPIDTYHGIVAKYHWFMQASDMERANAFGHMIGGAMIPIPAVGIIKDIAEVAQVARVSVSGAAASRFFAPLKSAKGFSETALTKHPLEGWRPEQVVQHANQLGLKTPRDQLILWSGLGRGETGKILSQEYVAVNGGLTLEMTAGGKWLDELDLFSPNSPFTREETLQIWSDVSTDMMQQASGQVRSLIGSVAPSSIYRQEQIELLANKNILGLDELNLKPRYSFGNY